MMDSPKDRAEALRREALWCLEQARTAKTEQRRNELITLAARFHDLANSTGAYSGIIPSLDDASPNQPITQQQQQAQPKKGGEE
jgi:hypothetical protein